MSPRAWVGTYQGLPKGKGSRSVQKHLKQKGENAMHLAALGERDGDVLKLDCADGCTALYICPKSSSCILGLQCINYTSVGQLLKVHLDTGENTMCRVIGAGVLSFMQSSKLCKTNLCVKNTQLCLAWSM